MEEYLIFAAIGGLLLLTLFINSVAEAYEQKQREKRIKILRIKQGLDELSELLDAIKSCDVSDAVRDLIVNEIMARLQTIQALDQHFRGIDALLEEASGEQEPVKKDTAGFYVKNEAEFKSKMVLLRRLIRLCSANNWYSKTNAKQLQQYVIELKLLRCEKVFQFYSDKASADSKEERYMAAKEHYYYILHALKNSTIPTNARVVELIEQVEFMMSKMSKMVTQNITNSLTEEVSEAAEEAAEKAIEQPTREHPGSEN
ncbi:MAG: hypothetical protein KZQ64_12755 [gamma proteobacterium symbiont of Bathyaustriella thionipta]|nr:hypothetical protein [gamma proteobacterium symbiont of Bathyaustriella thionipta]MCU7949790.1 hypothetical protein [gamma proteobacterium symbiont of Bathyaustriella thionipta]MCU7954241.1 hypothetical protein [gamma proteobacterium symbiont of Bathyaustriella thionipta]MCU7956384.1 hypothetical protein [gamma proteobacterium symbiont of Bathyaustriella thionipta]MCU7968522.1 hypothetical protein [gamma proteobacterium symbiont of Bathyaustriella thionipta]